MVRKLLKHEFLYYIRTIGLFIPWVLLLGVVARLFGELHSTNSATSVIYILTVLAATTCASILTVAATAVGVLRFYKNLFTAEGYLTLTLPVKHSQHIFVKTVGFVVTSAVCALVSNLTLYIAGAGLSYNISWPDGASMTHKAFWSVELVLVLIALAVAAPMLFYACIAVGQTAKKNRIVKAIFTYFGFSFAIYAFVIIAIIFFAAIIDGTGALSGQYGAIHGILIFILLVTLLLCFVFCRITLKVMRKKLNLE